MGKAGQIAVESNVISVNKLLANIKRYWWIFVLCILCGIFLTARGTIREYRNNVNLASRDLYVSGADFYLDSEVDKDSSIWTVIISSSLVREKTGNVLWEQFQEELREDDSYYIQEKGGRSCFGITVIGEGEEHTLALAKAVAFAFEEAVRESTSVAMRPIDLPVKANPCVVLQNGGILTFEKAEDRGVSLSLRDFLSWRKMMTMMAFVFIGLGIVFVLILFDNKIRGVEELQVICDKACIANLRKKGENVTAVIKMKQLLCDGGEDKIVLATLCDESAFHKVQQVLGEELAGRLLHADSICENAQGLEACVNQKKVVLAVRQDKDTVGTIREAMKNIELVKGTLAGYILV